MQIKTIQKVISKKMESWLESITDEKLRKRVKHSLLVSGGSITSLLLGEDVNDFDVYIKDKAVLIRLIKYYTEPFKGEIEMFDGAKRQVLVNGLEENYDEKIEYINSARAISIRNLKPDQVKMYFDGAQGGMKVNEDMKGKELKEGEEAKEYYPVYFSPNAISLSDDVQIVTRFYGDAEQIHKTFDFVHATNYFTWDDGLVMNKEALESIITKQLKYQGSLYPLTTIIRMKKFIKRNWNINAGEILKVMFQISELNLKDPDVLEEQLIGVDVAYFSKLIEVLRGRNTDQALNSAFLNKIIDKVFNSAEDIEEIS